MHVPKACAPGNGAYAEVRELGDFESPAPMTGFLLGDVGATLPAVDNAARALLVEATENDSEWLGEGSVPTAGNVDVLLLPSLLSCPFSTPVGKRTEATLGAIGLELVLVVGGGTADATWPSTFAVHLDTGVVAPVSTDLDLLTPRNQATVTAFGEGGLVAGGVDRSGTVQATAEVYDPGAGGFQQQQPISLSQARASHGATVLVHGETLLVGGVGGADGQTVLDTMEIVDPVTRTVRAEGVATLVAARKDPTVLLLASGEILVAGGLDANGDPVPTLEWFSADASQTSKRSQILATGAARTFVALEGGGALAVIAPPAGASTDFQDVWVIGADGAINAATPLGGAFGTQPVLFGGAGGAPVLFAAGRWLRWQPYAGAFGVLGVDIAANIDDATASPDSGLALWLDTTVTPVAVTALRFDAVGEYSALEGALLVGDTTDTAPDRLPSAGGITFDPDAGLTLGPGASAFVTDRTYADVTVDMDAPTGEPALLVLRDELGNELEVGGTSCPGALPKPGAASSLHVERTGASVVWTLAGGASGTCTGGVGASARLSVGVRAPASIGSVVRNLRVARVGTP
jgi:hypothetical protein